MNNPKIKILKTVIDKTGYVVDEREDTLNAEQYHRLINSVSFIRDSVRYCRYRDKSLPQSILRKSADKITLYRFSYF